MEPVKPPVFALDWRDGSLFMTYRHPDPFVVQVHRRYVPDAFAWRRVRGVSYYLTMFSEPGTWSQRHLKAQSKAIQYLVNQILTHGHPKPPQPGAEAPIQGQ